MRKAKAMTRITTGALIGCLFAATLAQASEPGPTEDAAKFIGDFRALQKECNSRLEAAYKKLEKAFEAATAEDDAEAEERLNATLAAEQDAIFAPAVPKAMKLVAPHAAEPAAVEPLVWIVQYGGETENARLAITWLMKHHITRQPTLELAVSRQYTTAAWVEPMLRAQIASSDLPEAARPKQTLALARWLQSEAERRQVADDHREAARFDDEALKLFAEIGEKYREAEYRLGITFGELAESSMYEIENLKVGKIAPDIIGQDLEGRPFKLSDYRGKAVMLSFWASWCGPCMELVPHERELVEQYKDRQFALVGVNGDQDKQQLSEALKAHPVTWRSFWSGEKGPLGPIPRRWNVNAWPTSYLIDHAGVIRAKNKGGAALDAMIEKLVIEAAEAAKKRK